MWELGHKEGWAPKNWCFWTVVLEKFLQSLLGSKEIKLVNPKGNQGTSQVVLVEKTLLANARDIRFKFDPWDGKMPWRRKWQSTPVFFLENPMDRGAWWATVHGFTKSWTWLKQLSTQSKSTLTIHWKDWCWSWSSSSLATWCKEPSHWKRPWYWERLRAGVKSDVTEDKMVGWYHWLNGHEFEVAVFSCSVVSNSLGPHGMRHDRFPYPLPSPRACSNSCPLTRWCHLTISSSVVPFSSCL